ncbi:hypothetical protein V8C44DRAFT_324485 [Trichoderma aethiopicum]
MPNAGIYGASSVVGSARLNAYVYSTLIYNSCTICLHIRLMLFCFCALQVTLRSIGNPLFIPIWLVSLISVCLSCIMAQVLRRRSAPSLPRDFPSIQNISRTYDGNLEVLFTITRGTGVRSSVSSATRRKRTQTAKTGVWNGIPVRLCRYPILRAAEIHAPWTTQEGQFLILAAATEQGTGISLSRQVVRQAAELGKLLLM